MQTEHPIIHQIALIIDHIVLMQTIQVYQIDNQSMDQTHTDRVKKVDPIENLILLSCMIKSGHNGSERFVNLQHRLIPAFLHNSFTFSFL